MKQRQATSAFTFRAKILSFFSSLSLWAHVCTHFGTLHGGDFDQEDVSFIMYTSPRLCWFTTLDVDILNSIISLRLPESIVLHTFLWSPCVLAYPTLSLALLDSHFATLIPLSPLLKAWYSADFGKAYWLIIIVYFFTTDMPIDAYSCTLPRLIRSPCFPIPSHSHRILNKNHIVCFHLRPHSPSFFHSSSRSNHLSE